MDTRQRVLASVTATVIVLGSLVAVGAGLVLFAHGVAIGLVAAALGVVIAVVLTYFTIVRVIRGSN